MSGTWWGRPLLSRTHLLFRARPHHTESSSFQFLKFATCSDSTQISFSSFRCGSFVQMTILTCWREENAELAALRMGSKSTCTKNIKGLLGITRKLQCSRHLLLQVFTPSILHNTMTSLFSFLLLVVMATLAEITMATDQKSKFLTTATGRRVPLAALTHISTPDVTARLYEVSTDLLLTGVDRAHDLKALTVPWVVSSSDDLPTITIDGVGRPDVVKEHRERHGGGYVVTHVADGTVIGVWGNGLALQPLDQIEHPGLFVNQRVSKVNEGNQVLYGDAKYPPQSYRLEAGGPIVQTAVIGITGSTEFTMSAASAASTASTGATLSAMLQNRGSCNNNHPKQLEIAVAFDSALCKTYGGSSARTVAAVLTAMSEAAAPYEAQTCIHFKVVLINGYCNPSADPYRNYSSLPTGRILEEFGVNWMRIRDDMKSDITLYVPGFKIKDATLGVAWVGGACSPIYSYGWAILEPIVMAHEIGHLMGADHADSGLMKGSWMPGDPIEFSSFSVKSIKNFVEGDRASSCLNENTSSGGGGGTVIPPFTTTTGSKHTNPSPTSGKTCGASFNRFNALTCSTKSASIAVYDSSMKVVGKTKLQLRQRTGHFHYRLAGGKSVLIRSISIVSSYDDSLTDKDMPAPRKYGPSGRFVHTTKRSIGKLNAPTGASTCCGQAFYTYVLIYHCFRKDTCAYVFFKGGTTTDCRKCARGKFRPMSVKNDCQSCS